jgi:hypothetical protein
MRYHKRSRLQEHIQFLLVKLNSPLRVGVAAKLVMVEVLQMAVEVEEVEESGKHKI